MEIKTVAASPHGWRAHVHTRTREDITRRAIHTYPAAEFLHPFGGTAPCNYVGREHEIAIRLGQETYNGSIMREIYWPHRHNGRRDVQDITVIPYFRAMLARARSAAERNAAIHRVYASVYISDFNTSNYRDGTGQTESAQSGGPAPALRFGYLHRHRTHLTRAAAACNFAESNFNVARIIEYRRYARRSRGNTMIQIQLIPSRGIRVFIGEKKKSEFSTFTRRLSKSRDSPDT